MGIVCVAVGALILLALIGPALTPTRCTVCSNPLRRKFYTWRIDGKKHRLCPTCNASMERQQSKAAMRRLQGKAPEADLTAPFVGPATRKKSGGLNGLVLLLLVVGAGIYFMQRAGPS